MKDVSAPNNDIHIIDDLSAGKRTTIPDDTTFDRADIRDSDVLERLTQDVDIVFHEAAVVSVARSVEDPPGVHETNTDATLRLLELARQRDSRVILASTAAVCGHPDSVPITETAPKYQITLRSGQADRQPLRSAVSRCLSCGTV